MALSAALCHCYTSGRCRHQYELVVSNMHMPLHALYSFGHWATAACLLRWLPQCKPAAVHTNAAQGQRQLQHAFLSLLFSSVTAHVSGRDYVPWSYHAHHQVSPENHVSSQACAQGSVM